LNDDVVHATVPPGGEPLSGTAPPSAGSRAAETAQRDGKLSGSGHAEGPALASVSAGNLHGSAQNYGTQNFNYGFDPQRASSTTSWQDQLIKVARIPEPRLQVEAAEVERRALVLHTASLMLLPHTAGLQEQALAHMRAVLIHLLQREPGRTVFTSGFDSAWQLHSLCRAGDWRDDLRNAIIYLDRSADPAAFDFFNKVEQAGALCEKLTAMGCRLILTVAKPVGASILDESELARRIAMWPFYEAQPAAVVNALPIQFNTHFERTLAMCAALLPGLAVAEFVALVNQLVPAPPSRTPAVRDKPSGSKLPTEPPTRHERWWHGERDVVLSELGVRLRRPTQNDGDAADPVEAGMFFDDPVWRTEMPLWLHSGHPILLAEHLGALTDRYFAVDASQRLRAGYRRLVLQLDAAGAHNMTAEWLLQRLRTSLESDQRDVASLRLAELLTEVPGGTKGDGLVARFIEGAAALLPALEEAPVAQLRQGSWLKTVIGTDEAPYAAAFWSALFGHDSARGVIEQTANRQAIVIDLLLALGARAAADVAEALGNNLAACNAAHEGWMQEADRVDSQLTVVSLARVAFRHILGSLLLDAPAAWVVLADAFCAAFPRIGAKTAAASMAHLPQPDAQERAARARWLAWDFVYALASHFDGSEGKALPDKLHATLLGDGARQRFASVLASLLAAAAPSLPRPDTPLPLREVRIEHGTMLWLYRSLALAAMAQPGVDPVKAGPVLADLVAPWRSTLDRGQRSSLIALAQAGLDDDFAFRDALAERSQGLTREQLVLERRTITQRIQALQVVLRALRGAAPTLP
jgi:hypothetical protein